MDFTLSDEQLMLSDSVSRFIDNDYGFELRQKLAKSTLGYSVDTWRQFAELGWTAVPFSETDGGFDGGPVELMILMREFGRGLVVEPYLTNVVLAGGVLRRAADAAQKQRLLAPIIAGEVQVTLAFAEPQARYDLANIATTASHDGDRWTLNGRKTYVLNAGNADILIVPARTSGETQATDGITLFAVRADTPGLSINAYPTVDGLRAAEIKLNNVSVDAGDLLGDIGGGFAVLEQAIQDATLSVCAEAVGIMQIMLTKTVEYTKNRVQFGVPISSFQALQHRMVDMYTASEQCQSLLLRAVMLNAAGDAGATQSVHAIKYQVGTAGRKVGQEAVQLHGGMGVTWELDIAHYFKRLTAIDQIFGNADWHLDRLAFE